MILQRTKIGGTAVLVGKRTEHFCKPAMHACTLAPASVPQRAASALSTRPHGSLSPTRLR
eukprot:6483311-Amphidinium_carterae.1